MVSFSARALAVGDQPFLGASKMKNGIQNSAAANAFPVLEFRPPVRKRKNFPNRFCGPLPPAPRSRGRTPSNASLAHHAAAANGERDSGWRIQSGFLLCAVAFLPSGTLGGSKTFNFGIGFLDSRACPTLQSGKLLAVRKSRKQRANSCGFRDSNCGKEMPLLRLEGRLGERWLVASFRFLCAVPETGGQDSG